MEPIEGHQLAWATAGECLLAISIPPADDEVLPGVRWGCPSELFTPAFWKYHSAAQRLVNRETSHRLGETLLEEIAVCLLGGYGMPAELALGAFHRLRDRNLLNADASRDEIERALSEPLQFARGCRRYRFPRQKAAYLWQAMQEIAKEDLPSAAKPLRAFLTNLPGIGPKTASWIVRNHMRSDEVAILDVHILRAGVNIGLFPLEVNIAKDYFKLEELFLNFCAALQEPASLIDALMWNYMRRVGRTPGMGV